MNQSPSERSFSSLFITLPICAVMFLLMWAWVCNDFFERVSAAPQINTSAPLGITVSVTGGNPCQNPNATLVSTGVTTSGTTAVQIIALSGTLKIYICSLTVINQSGTQPITFSLVQGTGTNCATGQTVVVPAFTTPVNSLFAFANPVSAGVAGNALCYLQTGTTPVTKVQIT